VASRFTVYFTRWFPRLGRMMYDWFVIPAAQHPDPDVFRKMVMDGVAALSAKDRALLDNVQLRDFLVDAAREHFRQGNQGLLDEWRIFVTEWGFELESVTFDNVRLWCGTDDAICPVHLSRKMAHHLPSATLTEVAGATHYSLLAEEAEPILQDLLASADE
jgi:pimeloyl-ACP methyl ester carboxylesterase